MRSSATECIKSLSHRNKDQASLSRRELLDCQQEMVQLSKQLNGVVSERRSLSRFQLISKTLLIFYLEIISVANRS